MVTPQTRGLSLDLNIIRPSQIKSDFFSKKTHTEIIINNVNIQRLKLYKAILLYQLKSNGTFRFTALNKSHILVWSLSTTKRTTWEMMGKYLGKDSNFDYKCSCMQKGFSSQESGEDVSFLCVAAALAFI